jgi:hypothetical protein
VVCRQSRDTVLLLSRVARWHIFRPKILISGKFGSVLQWQMLVNFMAIGSIVLPFCIFHCHLAYFMVILVYFPVLVCCTGKKSGNPVFKCKYPLTFEYWYLPTMTPLTKLLRRSSWTLMTWNEGKAVPFCGEEKLKGVRWNAPAFYLVFWNEGKAVPFCSKKLFSRGC